MGRLRAKVGARLPDAMRTGDPRPLSVNSPTELTTIYRSSVDALKGVFVTRRATLAPARQR